MAMKFLLFVIFATIGGTLGLGQDDCKAKYKTYFTNTVRECEAFGTAFDTSEFPFIDLGTDDGKTALKTLVSGILGCVGCAPGDSLDNEARMEIINYAFDENARKSWKADLKDWLKKNKKMADGWDTKMRKTTYLFMNPKEADDTGIEAIGNKCAELRARIDDETFTFVYGDDAKNLKKLRKRVGDAGLACSDAPRGSSSAGAAPGSMIGGGGGAPGGAVAGAGGPP